MNRVERWSRRLPEFHQSSRARFPHPGSLSPIFLWVSVPFSLWVSPHPTPRSLSLPILGLSPLSLWVSLPLSLSPSLGFCPLKHSIFPTDAPGTLGGVAELPGTTSAGVRANQLHCAAVLLGATWTIKPKLALEVEVLSVLRGSEGICMSEQYVKGAIPADSVLA